MLAPHERLDEIARAVGVGRGVDLITYVFEVGVAFVLPHYYTKFVDLQRQPTGVTHELAILRAEREESGGDPAAASGLPDGPCER